MPSTRPNLLAPDERGLRCAAGDFHVDPWRPVATAVITHAHSDHARSSSDRYLCVEECVAPLRHRLRPDARIEGVPRGERIALRGTTVSFHPAGHVLGSAQARIEGDGGVWVVTGDCKRQPDPTCALFEVVPCDTLVIEATFALPIYRWPPIDDVIDELARREPEGLPGPILLHGAIVGMTDVYRAKDVRLAPTEPLGDRSRAERGNAQVITRRGRSAGRPTPNSSNSADGCAATRPRATAQCAASNPCSSSKSPSNEWPVHPATQAASPSACPAPPLAPRQDTGGGGRGCGAEGGGRVRGASGSHAGAAQPRQCRMVNGEG